MALIRILLVDDHAIVRQGLRALLAAEADMAVVGEAETGRQAVRLAKKLLPDVAIMDIAMPMLNGLEATRQIMKAVPATRVLVLSSYNDDEYIEQLTAAGAAGYLLKQTVAAELIKAVREARSGRAFFSPAISRRLHNQRREAHVFGTRGKPTSLRLGSREVEVVQLIAEGRTNKQIAAELGLSVKTVEKYRQQAMDKLNIHDIAGLTRYAISKGIIPGDGGVLT